MDEELTDRFIGAITDWVQQLIRMNTLVATDLGLIPTDLHCLHVLQQDGPMTTGKLGEHVGLSAGAASRMIDRLESAGFVTRARDVADRRKVTVATTPAGLERAGTAYGGLTERTRRDLASFTSDELQVIIRFVELSLRSVESEASALATRGTPA
ncbi:MarR family winged helix-turn-helix transcriptional regulator [Micromonospora sp. MW-13]|uniref:MarR family winged helix-turn-helix transcriptional regulator n=1 Tax=Micromonospora sp. MW-13 TaxID=2094022 RepID=UPI001A9F4174|nr:MarR family transcriptional regulator [Micromonospora sp. MW-13]